MNEFIELKPVNEVPIIPLSELADGNIFGYTNDGDLKRTPTSELLSFVKSGVTGTATESNSPTTWTSGDPDLYESYLVVEPITTGSAWGIEVTQTNLDENFVYFNVQNGVVSVFKSIKPELEPFTNTGIKQITDWNYPLVDFPTTEIRQQLVLAIKEIYIKNADFDLYDYLITDFRRSQDLGGGYPNNRYEINIAVVDKGTTTLVKEFGKVINSYVEPVGLDLWNLGDFYILIDWSKFPNKSGFSVARNLDNRISRRVEQLNSSPNITNILRDFSQNDFQNVITPQSSTQIDLSKEIVKQQIQTDSGIIININERTLYLPTENVWLLITGVDYGLDVSSTYIYLDASKNPVGTAMQFNANEPFQINNTNPFVAIRLKPPTTIFYQPKIFKKSTNDFKIDKINGLPISSGDALKKVDADTYYEPIGTAYSKVVSDAKYALESSTLTTAEADSRYELVGSASSTDYKFVDARDFGFLTTNTASQNVTAMNAGLLGGNKTITISSPGIYKVNATMWIESNTEIIFGKGVVISLDSNCWNIFCNKNAPNRLWNTDITIIGLKIQTNGFYSFPPPENILYGLRGIINFFYIKKLRIYDFECLDGGNINYQIHVARWYDVLFDNIVMKGMKDGIHLNCGKKMIIRNVDSTCYDDTIALNAADYNESNIEIGNIEDVYIENVTWNYQSDLPSYGGRVINNYIGVYTSWVSGMILKQGDKIIHNGKMFAVYIDYAGTEIASVTEPSSIGFTSLQTTPEGISWKLVQDYVSTESTIKNLTIKNLVETNSIKSTSTTLFNIMSGADGNSNRSIHPSIPTTDYPEIDFTLDGVRSQKGFVNVLEQCGVLAKISNWKDRINGYYFVQSQNTAKKSFWNISKNDFRTNYGGIDFGNNADVVLRDNLQLSTDVLTIYSVGSRVRSNTNLNSEISFSPIKGDEIIVLGVKKIYNGSTWVNLN